MKTTNICVFCPPVGNIFMMFRHVFKRAGGHNWLSQLVVSGGKKHFVQTVVDILRFGPVWLTTW